MSSKYQRAPRTILPEDFQLSNYESIAPYVEKLLNEEPKGLEELLKWIQYNEELEAFIGEEMAWRYINYTRHTDDEKYVDAYSFFVKEIQPKLVKAANEYNKALVGHSQFKELPDDPLVNFKKKSQLAIDLFREKNIELGVKQTNLAQKYATITGALSIEHNGEELTMQQAGKMLLQQNRELRKEIFDKTVERRATERAGLNEIFDELVSLRTEEAKNCGFDNYRDFKHTSLGRFDYTVKDVLDFHDAIEKIAVPIQKEILETRRKRMGLEELRPYDLQLNVYGDQPLKPFKDGEELLSKAIECFERLDPFFGETLKTMKSKGFLDLESRKGKASGGYNYPLDEHGIPFIFMNASGSMRDVTTMVHEGGHAVHSMLSRDIAYTSLKHCPSEVAELASMSMELISMDHWGVFFDNEKDLTRAKIEQLEGVLDVLPWIAIVDKFQHWVYTNPNHTVEERDQAWTDTFYTFNSRATNYSGYEDHLKSLWHKQLHVFEVPFYYIEYAIAQLGAIAIWKNYKEKPEQALKQYKEALALGYTKPIHEIYAKAGIEFNFGEAYVKDLLGFVKDEMDSLIERYESFQEATT